MPIQPLPYAQRLRNRIIALGIFATLCFMIGSCIFGGGAPEAPLIAADTISNGSSNLAKDSAASDSGARDIETAMAEGSPLTPAEQKAEDMANAQAAITAAVTPEVPPEIEVIDSTHIKAQKNVFLAEKIDNMLRRFKPMYGVILVVDVQTNEIIAWGERKD